MFLNITNNEFCPYCQDDAQVLVGTEIRTVFEYRNKNGRRVASHNQAHVVKETGQAEFDQYGPCPRCERGKVLEFPPPDEKGKDRVGPWGKDGYWQGRSTDFLVRRTMGKPPSALEVRKLLTTVGWVKEIET